jgi:hypothetical protein
MTLSPEQQKRVDAVLSAEHSADAFATLGSMSSPEELHALVLAYNWDDGFGLPMAVLEHQSCERATAVHIYFAAEGPWSDPSGVSEAHRALLARAKEQTLSGRLSERSVSYDPVVEWELDRVALYKLRQNGVSEEVLRRCGPT